ncbi:MAG: hypothetical protein ACNA8P_07880 [Phycisphaerales bacterium]
MHTAYATACAAAVIAGCVGTASAQVVDIYFSDFENTDGGWVGSGSGNFAGDWEYEANYDPSLYAGAYQAVPSAFSGTGMWGTLMYDDHTNSGEFSYLRQTFDFSGFTDVSLSFASWSHVFTNFDYTQVNVNGTLVASSRSTDPVQQLTNESSGALTGQWVTETIDLSDFDGEAIVEIEFLLFATTVVNRPGWYIDDVRISGIPTPGTAGLVALAGLSAVRRRR